MRRRDQLLTAAAFAAVLAFAFGPGAAHWLDAGSRDHGVAQQTAMLSQSPDNR